MPSLVRGQMLSFCKDLFNSPDDAASPPLLPDEIEKLVSVVGLALKHAASLLAAKTDE